MKSTGSDIVINLPYDLYTNDTYPYTFMLYITDVISPTHVAIMGTKKDIPTTIYEATYSTAPITIICTNNKVSVFTSLDSHDFPLMI